MQLHLHSGLAPAITSPAPQRPAELGIALTARWSLTRTSFVSSLCSGWWCQVLPRLAKEAKSRWLYTVFSSRSILHLRWVAGCSFLPNLGKSMTRCLDSHQAGRFVCIALSLIIYPAFSSPPASLSHRCSISHSQLDISLFLGNDSATPLASV